MLRCPQTDCPGPIVAEVALPSEVLRLRCQRCGVWGPWRSSVRGAVSGWGLKWGEILRRQARRHAAAASPEAEPDTTTQPRP